MARIIGGIGTSHVPTIGMAFDQGKRDDPAWEPLFRGYQPVARWLSEKKPDVLFFCFNDHATTFFFDHYPTFALGVSAEYAIADEGLGPRPIPPLKGHAPLARHVVRSLVEDEFDLSVFQDLPLDHGLHSPLTMMWPSQPDWPGRVVPLVVNVLQHPLPTPARCFKLGRHLRTAIESYPEDLKVVVVGTGGLSHQLDGKRAGFINKEFDQLCLDKIVNEPEALASYSIRDWVDASGAQGVEFLNWMAMRGALTGRVSQLHRNYHIPISNTAAATVVLENAGQEARKAA